ncbi:LytTR family DNA-binding domain-containing protein [Niameybacter massiliensis]|uniref:Stage 0 sporulation protein A homolog n=1 Tax=Holtiella tumoricola TaxID=3018743 RepID=A0AA42DKA1_9FIRM|nr:MULTISPECIES: LytTR family DNA-binding domain-containing protein [Lachnospirales]MDA3730422.1 LytTR family DNA-binding domain-containing protein [Holtiella tumoricola]
MIKIAICEDDSQERAKLRRYITAFAAERGAELSVDDYASGEAFLEQWDGAHYHVLFLDVYMGGMTGIELAKHVRTIDEKVMIIFVTSDTSHALEGYKIHAYDYIIKPIQHIDFIHTLQDIMNHIQVDDEPAFIFPTTGGDLRLKLKDIYYIESNIRKTNIYLDGEQYTCQYNINTLEEKLLKSGFIRTHRSFLVNMARLKLIKGNEVFLENGQTVFLSKYKQKEVKVRFMHYLGGTP